MAFRRLTASICGALALALSGGVAVSGELHPAPLDQVHDDRLILLGTQGGPIPSSARAGIATLLVVSGTPYLVDTGEGVVRQLSKVGFTPRDIRTIFISHHHVDHQADLPSLIAFSWFTTSLSGQDSDSVEILGPPATQAAVGAALDYLSISERTFGQMGDLPSAREMFVVTDILEDGVVYDDANVRVTAVENTHYRNPSVAPNGTPDRSLSFRFDTPTFSVVFTGDTGPSEELVELARGADVLVSEVSMQFIEPPLPEASGMPVDPSLLEQMRWHHTMQHLTPEAVGELATKAGVGKVVLTHLVPGGKSSDASRYATEVGKYFSGDIIVGEDFMSITLGVRDHAQPAS